jgi:hypothetical protein
VSLQADEDVLDVLDRDMMPKQLPHGRAPSSRRNIERPLPCEATAAKQDTDP